MRLRRCSRDFFFKFSCGAAGARGSASAVVVVVVVDRCSWVQTTLITTYTCSLIAVMYRSIYNFCVFFFRITFKYNYHSALSFRSFSHFPVKRTCVYNIRWLRVDNENVFLPLD